MNSHSHKKRLRRDLHYLNKDGMVACNPRDSEAAHRAEVEGIATEDVDAVTAKNAGRSFNGKKNEVDPGEQLKGEIWNHS